MVRRVEEDARIQQLVEQQRMCRDLPHQEPALRAQVNEPPESAGVLVQQREVCRAPTDRLDDRQRARQRLDRLRLAPRKRDDRRHQRVEPLAARLVEAQIEAAVAKRLQLL